MFSDEVIQKAQRLYDFAIALGYSHASAIGVCANVMAESGFNEGASEVGGSGFGLGQWTPQQNLTNQAIMLGYTYQESLTFDVQCDILLRGDETGQWLTAAYNYDPLVVVPLTLTQYKNMNDILVATMNYMAHWERPSEDPNRNHKERRKQHAVEFDSVLNGGGGTGKSKPVFPTVEGLPVTSEYGYRGDIGVPGASEYHWAIDIGSGGMTDPPIYATQKGVVDSVGTYSNGAVYVIIKHTGDPYWSRYLHLKSYSVSVGQVVSKGEQIGIMGNTGISSGVHLDFAISNNGVFETETSTIDPEVYLQMEFDGGGDNGSGGGDKGKELIHLLLVDALHGWKL